MAYKLVRENDYTPGEEVIYRANDLLEIAAYCENETERQPFDLGIDGGDLL